MSPDVGLFKLASLDLPENSVEGSEKPENAPVPLSQKLEQQYHDVLAESLFEPSSECQGGLKCRVLSFRDKVTSPSSPNSVTSPTIESTIRGLLEQNRTNVSAKILRHIPSTPERILDAPDLTDDYYLNLLDWSNSNVLAVGLGSCLYLWNAVSGSIEMLLDSGEDSITSLKWNTHGTQIAVGFDQSTVQVWDVIGKSNLRTISQHRQ